MYRTFLWAGNTRTMKQKFSQFRKSLEPRLNAWAVRLFNSILKPFSRISRRVFEFGKIKQTLGLLVIILVISMAILPSSLAATQTNLGTNQAQVNLEEIPFNTVRSIRLPLDSFTLTQGYSFFHPGLDLATVKGSPVYAVMEGTIESVKRDRWAYGNHVIIDHGNGMKSLYAHLSKIEVKEGEKVTNDSVIGLAGSTGWSTGPHLHLQVWQNEKLVNPKSFFEAYFGQRLVSRK